MKHLLHVFGFGVCLLGVIYVKPAAGQDGSSCSCEPRRGGLGFLRINDGVRLVEASYGGAPASHGRLRTLRNTGVSGQTGGDSYTATTRCGTVTLSVAPLPQYMQAQFKAKYGDLKTLATDCGFSNFNWQSVITTLPPGNISPEKPAMNPDNIAPDGTMVAPPTFYDPPPGGYSGADYNPYPFYILNDRIHLTPGPAGACTMSVPGPTPGAVVRCCGNPDPQKVGCEANFPWDVSVDGTTLSFLDGPANKWDCPFVGCQISSSPPAGTFVALTTTLVAVSDRKSDGSASCGDHYCTPLYFWKWNSTFSGRACKGLLDPFFHCNKGGVTFTTVPQEDGLYQIIPDSGTGGVTVTNINGVDLPPVVPEDQIATTASGLAYSRVTQTFDGTVTATNISNASITGPIQIVLFGITDGVPLANETSDLSGTPYITVPDSPTLAPGQSVTVNVQFQNPSDATINFTPVIYAGSFN